MDSDTRLYALRDALFQIYGEDFERAKADLRANLTCIATPAQSAALQFAAALSEKDRVILKRLRIAAD